MKKKSYLSIIIPLFIAIISVTLLAVSGHINGVKEGNVPTKAPKAVTTEAPAPETTTAPQVSEVSFIAVGDNLIHDSIYKAGTKSDGTMDFSGLYKHIKPYAEAADVAIMNQETVLGGDIRYLSGYPMFNSPQEIGDAAVDAGFDVFTCATNHALDVLKADGLMAEMDFYETKHPEVMYVGINKSEEAYNTVKYLEKNGITFALLNYTYGTNGIPLPSDQPWVVNMLDDEEKVKSDIATAKEHADCVIVFPHWGTEYYMGVSDYQKKFTKLFSDAGVDIVIGTHPHCIEPVEWVTNEETGHKMLVYYSLGNFISSQHDLNTLLGGMAEFTVRKEGDTVTIENPKMAPLVTYYKYQTAFTTYKFGDYTSEIAKTHRHANIASRSAVKALYEKTVDEEFRDED